MHLQLIVLNKTNPGSNPVVFTCGQWMGTDVGDGQLSRILKLGSPPLTSRKYKVCYSTLAGHHPSLAEHSQSRTTLSLR
jgi:hypothetical protein